MIVISDTTPIISLMKVSRLDILEKIYKDVTIPEAVYNELCCNKNYTEEAQVIQNSQFIKTEKVKNTMSVDILRNVTGLDIGESEALVLCREQNADLLLMDENKGRKVAKQMDIRHIGTVGILMMAYDKGLMKAEDILDCIEIMIESDIRLSKNLCNKVLEYVGFEPIF